MDNRGAVEQAVRNRARELWREAGQPQGREAEFLAEARRLVIHSGVAGSLSAIDAELDQAGKDSFPASDPVNRT
jgi:hypothetical protein